MVWTSETSDYITNVISIYPYLSTLLYADVLQVRESTASRTYYLFQVFDLLFNTICLLNNICTLTLNAEHSFLSFLTAHLSLMTTGDFYTF